MPEITVLVERLVPDPDAPHDTQRAIVEIVPELRRLVDHREVEDAWLEYLVEKWEPWAKEMRRWQEVKKLNHEPREPVNGQLPKGHFELAFAG